ncbi:ScbR family autoregulator-binding transcription factor [Streptomyces filamentosus]|uniref:TetR family transcriptional regulator n=1 Tax=Streptomyces filamentosus TaxID=67294 RepID=A0A919EHE6_STRFL|nr:ScbR family autoregulator-binding transcription factor [Streptomyces filamentosus]KAA6211286.1 TetR/AcrR family transcriptional regulator [Streptomyces filamentosus]GHF78765.1 TetR family transcriptional regulator [Streptomyces filamentosus]
MSKQERAARTRYALIRSAAELFEQRGYAQARLAEISAGAGVSSGALHFHFENKAAVAQAVENEASRSLRRAARAAQERNADALQTLTDTSHALARLLQQDVVVRAGYRLNCDAAGRPELNLRQEWQSCVQSLLSQAADEGALADGVSHREVATVVVAATTGLEVLAGDEAEWLSRASLTVLWRLLLPRIATPSALRAVDPRGRDSVTVALEGAVLRTPVPLPTQTPPRSPAEP